MLILANLKQATDLVGTGNEVKVMPIEELGDNVRAKGEGDASVVLSPALCVLVRV